MTSPQCGLPSAGEKMKEMKVPFVDLSRQYQAIFHEVQDAMAKVLTRCDFILGEDVSLFESEFAQYCQAAHCVGVSSGTAAIKLALLACGIQKGDEVITVPNTWFSTVQVIYDVGATIKFVDINPQTYTMDVNALAGAITKKTKAVIPVHLFGRPVDMEPLLELAKKYNLKVIEDACQAHGALYKNRRVGSLGDVGCFSFYPGKNLGCYGDGGAITTNNDELAEKIRLLRNYGQQSKNVHVIKGFNERLDTLHAAILRVKLRYLDGWNKQRREHAQKYNELLPKSVVTPVDEDLIESVYHLYVVRSSARDKLARHLSAAGISCGIHYPTPIHLQQAYADLRIPAGSYPVSEQYAHQILSLPMFAELTDLEIEQVCTAVREFGS